MKFFGIVLVFAGCAGTGLYAGHQVRRQIALYQKLLFFIEDCQIALRYQNLTLTELFQQLAEKQEYQNFDFLQRLCLSEKESPETLWKKALTASQFPCDAEEILKNLGSALGKSDLEGQTAMFHLCQHQMQKALETAQAVSTQKCRLYQALGWLGGAMLAILFL